MTMVLCRDSGDGSMGRKDWKARFACLLRCVCVLPCACLRAKRCAPGGPNAVKSASLEATRLSPRGGGGAPCGWASFWEYRAAPEPPGAP